MAGEQVSPTHTRPRPPAPPISLRGANGLTDPYLFPLDVMQMSLCVTSWDKSSAIFSFWLSMRSGWRLKGGRGAAGAARAG